MQMRTPSAWSPRSWRERPALQQPDYPDLGALEAVCAALAKQNPLVSSASVLELRSALAAIPRGEAFLLHGGDCAERLRDAEADADAHLARTHRLLTEGAELLETAGRRVIRVGRWAGQLAKPRSRAVEMTAGAALPIYRGDAVNDPAPDLQARTPDPRRLSRARSHAEETLVRLGQLEGGDVCISHEALLLPFEEALTRWDASARQWWASSAHYLWIGARTGQPEGAHVEWMRGICNPVGVKCGPHLSTGSLLRLLERLDPDRSPGRLTLIPRLGAVAGDHLPGWVRAVKSSGHPVVWCSDPMHANTVTTAGGLKTRAVEAIIDELGTFFDILESEREIPGGVHLECTGDAVRECVGGRSGVREAELGPGYETACDPRLDREQTLEVLDFVRQRLQRRPEDGE